MKTSATNRRLRVLLTAIKSGTLVPRPEFQRRLVWTNRHKQEFIRTVLLGYPFPEIYIAAGDVNAETGEGSEMLVDGQQRMMTLYQYFTGADALRTKEIRPYKNLDEQEKLGFLEYEVVIRDLGQKSIAEILDVFSRINSTGYSLNAMEVHNARFDGAFKQFADKLREDPFFEEHNIFRTNDIRRMGDTVFCLTLVITIMSAYFNRDDELEVYLDRYNDDYPMGAEIDGQIRSVFDFINRCGFDDRCRIWKKADIFTALVETHRAIIVDKVQLEPGRVKSLLSDFYQLVEQAGKDSRSEYPGAMQYYQAALQASNDRSSRITRGKIFSAVIRFGIESLKK